jgi:hypothetical protein
MFLVVNDPLGDTGWIGDILFCSMLLFDEFHCIASMLHAMLNYANYHVHII